MNTQEIIEFVAESFSKDIAISSIGFSDWLKIYRSWESYSPSILAVQTLSKIVPLRDPVVKLIYKKLYSLMPFDREYILKNYEKNHNGIDYLVYPSNNAKRLVVLLSGYSDRKTYNRYSWFWDDAERWNESTVYLFLNDIENTWYCGHNNNKVDIYKNIISMSAARYNIQDKDIFLVGGSMGGYGAFRIGSEINVGGIISINPQTSIEAVSLHNDRSWFESIKKCGNNFIPVHELIDIGTSKKIYLECGKYIPDSFDLEKISKVAAAKGGFFIFNYHTSTKHVTASPNKKQLEKIISLFSDDIISNATAEKNCSLVDGTF
ncbi:hypothetical protein ACEUBK_04020 [Aeromonas hydrophila]|uniref:hypothetical protein n=1 Tax=Aeromonas hydrophila TaxID=644 RepID=UPI0038D0F63D